MLFRKDHTKQEFEGEFLPHLEALYRTAVRLLNGNRDEANDLVQDTFTQAWNSFNRYERGTNARAWLYAILMNKARHYHRRSATRKVISLSDHGNENLLETVESSPLVPESISDEGILAALDQLSEEHREVVLLADVQEFSYKEVAQILEIPIGTVMSRLSRARSGLRSYLTDYAEELGIRRAKSGGNE